MTDKEKFRKEVEKLKSNLIHGACSSQIAMETLCKEEAYNEVLAILDTMQEEPVSIWHGMSEEAENGRNIIIIDPKDFYGAVLRKGGSQLRNHNKERYVKWAYIDDIIKLSNVERTGKNRKEEPVKRTPADIEAAMQEVEEKSRVFTEAHKGEDTDTILAQMRGEEHVSEELEEASKNYALNNTPWDDCKDEIQESFKAGAKWQKAKDESTTEDLGDYINKLSKQFPEVSFAKLSRISVRVAKWQAEQFKKDCADLCNGIATVKGVAVAMAYDKGMAAAREQMMKNIWKPADGDDLPIIDREVIALLDNGKVVFAHRPPEYWDGKDIITGKVTRNYPKTYDKGGWNIPDTKWWLDCSLPKEIEL